MLARKKEVFKHNSTSGNALLKSDEKSAISQLLDRIKNKDPSQRPEVLRSVSSVSFKNDNSVEEKSKPDKSNDLPQTSKSTDQPQTCKSTAEPATSWKKLPAKPRERPTLKNAVTDMMESNLQRREREREEKKREKEENDRKKEEAKERRHRERMELLARFAPQ